jgi:hypothetical protein
VCLSPVAVLTLRVVDESGSSRLVTPLAWLFAVSFALAVLVGLLVTLERSTLRAAAGLVVSVVAVVTLVVPLFRVTLGRTACPPRIGPDTGLDAAVVVMDAWKNGEAAPAMWQRGEADPSWRERARRITLIDYRLVDSGCWERVAPIATSSTWHEFRVTVQQPDGMFLSKTVLLHMEKESTTFRVAAVDGPLP